MIAKVLTLTLAVAGVQSLHVVNHLSSVTIPKGHYIQLSNKKSCDLLSADQSTLN